MSKLRTILASEGLMPKKADDDLVTRIFLDWWGQQAEPLLGDPGDPGRPGTLSWDLYEAVIGNTGYPRSARAQVRKALREFEKSYMKKMDAYDAKLMRAGVKFHE